VIKHYNDAGLIYKDFAHKTANLKNRKNADPVRKRRNAQMHNRFSSRKYRQGLLFSMLAALDAVYRGW